MCENISIYWQNIRKKNDHFNRCRNSIGKNSIPIQDENFQQSEVGGTYSIW